MSKNSESRVFNIAIVGATGAVGETLLQVLQDREFPVGELYLLASERSAGSVRKFKDRSIRVENLAEFEKEKKQTAVPTSLGAI